MRRVLTALLELVLIALTGTLGFLTVVLLVVTVRDAQWVGLQLAVLGVGLTALSFWGWHKIAHQRAKHYPKHYRLTHAKLASLGFVVTWLYPAVLVAALLAGIWLSWSVSSTTSPSVTRYRCSSIRRIRTSRTASRTCVRAPTPGSACCRESRSSSSSCAPTSSGGRSPTGGEPCAGLVIGDDTHVKGDTCRARSPTSSPVSPYPISTPASIGTRGSSGDPQTVASGKRFSGKSTSTPGSSSLPNAERAGAGRITLAVAGLDAHLERLVAQRIEHEPIEIYSNGVRHVNVPDPDGNAIAFAEPPDAASASPRLV